MLKYAYGILGINTMLTLEVRSSFNKQEIIKTIWQVFLLK